MSAASTAVYTPRHPFLGVRVSSYRIIPPGAPKDTRHHVVSLAGSGIVYHPGDALGVCPRNPEPLVDAILQRLGATGDEMVTAGHSGTIPLHEALSAHFDLALPSKRLLEACLAQGAEVFRPLLEKGAEEHLKHYLHAWDDVHDVLGVLKDAPQARFTAAEFSGLIKKRHRLKLDVY
jgi:sulfite reductase (NADPH) flavoprotein alpha-component